MTQMLDFIRVADTETTGFPPDAEMVEVGWTDLRLYPSGWEIEDDQRAAFVNPGRPIPAEASAIHGITDDMVVDGISPDEARRMITAGPAILVAHNVDFDSKFLRGHNLPWICTLRCARELWPGMRNHKNETIREELGIVVPTKHGAHRAGYDSAVTARILLELLNHMTVEQMVEISKPTREPLRMPFGRHAGKRFSDIDPGYLGWILGSDRMDAGIKAAAHRELQRRARP